MGDAVTPLLANGPAAEEKPRWGRELREIAVLAVPASVQLLAQDAIIVVNQIMAGGLGAEALAAAAIGNTLFSIMWYFLLGISTALDTLGSQAFGARDRAGVIAWSVAATAMMVLLSVPMAAALWCGRAIAATLFGQEEALAQMVGVYTRAMIPGLTPFVLVLVTTKAMQSQNVMRPAAYITLGVFLANIGINKGMIAWLGFEGAAYAQSVTRVLWALCMAGALLTVSKQCIDLNAPVSARELEGEGEAGEGAEEGAKKPPGGAHGDHGTGGGEAAQALIHTAGPGEGLTWGVVVREGLQWGALLEFCKIGLPGGFMMALDAGSWDITTAMAGFLGTTVVDAHTALLNVCICTFMAFVFGMATAATIRVGNLLGAGRPQLARLSGFLSVGICCAMMCCNSAAIFACRNVLGYLFVDDPAVVALVARTAYTVALYQPADGFYGCSSGVLRGMGAQSSLLFVNLVGFWVCGVCTAYYLTFVRGWGLEGLWCGIITGVTTSAVLNGILLARVDWQREARAAMEVAKKGAQGGPALPAVAEEEAGGQAVPPSGGTIGVAVAGGSRALGRIPSLARVSTGAAADPQGPASLPISTRPSLGRSSLSRQRSMSHGGSLTGSFKG